MNRFSFTKTFPVSSTRKPVANALSAVPIPTKNLPSVFALNAPTTPYCLLWDVLC